LKTLKHILPLEWQFSQLALEKASEAIFGVDANANIYRVNEAACRYLGYSREELTKLKVFDIDPNYTPRNWPEIIEKIKNAGMLVFESSHRAKNGKILPIEIAANHFEFNRKDYFCAFVRNITRHKMSEQILRDKSEHQLELFFSQSLDGFFFMMLDEPVTWGDTVDQEKVLDYVFEHQRITKVNDAMLAQYGAAPEQFVGLTPNDLYRHDIQYGRKVWREFFGAGRLHIETDERKLDGTPIWIEGDYICFYDNQGRITGHFGIQRDITERKLAALQEAELKAQIERHAAELEIQVARRTAELAQSEARLRAIGNALPDVVFVVDEEGRYLEILTAATDLLYEKAEIRIGKLIHDFIPKPIADRFLAAIGHTLATGEITVIEYQLKVPAGLRWFEGRTGMVDFQIDGKKIVVFVARDITDRKCREELENQNIYLQEEIRSQHNFGEIIGASKAIEQVFAHIELVSGTDSTVLLTGETGTGKELIARAIHDRSSHKNHTMIKVNCGAIPSGLVESELFGHEKGAFTGAVAQKKGKFELAHHGTIFLDEIGDLPHDIQVKLLRVLQEQEFERVGGSQTIKVDVRVIAATNRDLQAEVKRGAFRSDLFFRLDIFPIRIPPLRARKEDIPLLTNFFIAKFSHRMGKRIQSINQKPLDALIKYHWPGNVRELANILERAVILCRGNVLRNEHIVGLTELEPSAAGIPLTLAEAERQHILQILKMTDGVVGGLNGAAAILGINRSTLRSRMQKLGIAVLKEVLHG
jgi:PAS domain S-box-containing protein